ncbi:hypothetical protein SDC9_159905 [bioreactor metagenome]|uniref:Uncharacterized protein n=1 Tax=bioreactor metagenome TaxID=1076179 RepID=A0A645FE56_9ZZZZ
MRVRRCQRRQAAIGHAISWAWRWLGHLGEIQRHGRSAAARRVDPVLAQFGAKVEFIQLSGRTHQPHLLKKGVHRPMPITRLQRQCLGDGFHEGRGILHAELLAHGARHARKRDHAVADGTQRGRQRHVVADEAVDHGSKRIQVAPRPGLELAVRIGILLDGRVVHLQHGGVLAVAVANGKARRAQVQQHRRPVVLQKDIVGRDVAVQRLAIMQNPQSAAHRPDHLAQPLF